MILSKKGRIYKQKTVLDIKKQLGRLQTNSARASVKIEFYPPDKRKRDLDNYLKALFDAITSAGVWADDSQVDFLSMERKKPIKKGMIKIQIDFLGVNDEEEKTTKHFDADKKNRE